MLQRCGQKGTLLHCWWERKLIQPLWRTVWRFLKKLKIELPNDPAISLLGIYPEKTIIQQESCTTMFIVALFTIVKDMQTQITKTYQRTAARRAISKNAARQFNAGNNSLFNKWEKGTSTRKKKKWSWIPTSQPYTIQTYKKIQNGS